MKQNRRHFIRTSAAGSAALLLASLDSVAMINKPEHQPAKGFGIQIMATNWGIEGTMDSFCNKAKQAGYDGIELWWTDDKKEQDEIFNALKKYDLEIGFLCGGWQTDPAEHLAAFKKMIDDATGQSRKKPVYINNQSGRDYFSFDDNAKFIEYTLDLAKQTGIKICHETHRGRMLYAAPVARTFMNRYPDLKLTLDISHWCCVHESLLADQQETVNQALERVEHIHARIGHQQGPQVNDPKAPEWENAVKAHFAWWDKVVERKRKEGGSITFLTEFGPPDYMPTMPFTRKPLADLWQVNVGMMQLLKKRYAS
ncbi:sugar phosphate isomerase/epimerase [Niabella yanshanensis]|uniref:Sugar phosphate isomerase/epimerase n=1 Tax=Niabella yanshanensis TaxID=577386 RepID=A0ABZ0WBN4_9BACT|nr:sugar phosphate isomerase/epimerase [Niabella yanshanensis]WQD40069.1 sugar phosphate isomerase/epimerase [Niabella yanshanensis]